jgi:glycosyltransferase involved in cell wall biosynthesis
VVTVHDLVPERLYGVCGDWAVGEIERKRECVLCADICICVSQATADDLIRFYPELKGRVRVVHHGAEHLGELFESRARPAEPPFALFVGQRNYYKNFRVVLDAIQHPEWPNEVSLHVVGPPFAPHEISLVAVLGLKDRIVHLGRLSDDKLRFQYRTASCFLFPSLLEGFGLPIVEAQMNGCPVVASDIPVFHEVAGPAALFFDPRRGEKLAIAVAESLKSHVQTRLVEQGVENAKRFSWERAADQIIEIYEEMVERRR